MNLNRDHLTPRFAGCSMRTQVGLLAVDTVDTRRRRLKSSCSAISVYLGSDVLKRSYNPTSRNPSFIREWSERMKATECQDCVSAQIAA